MRIEGVERESGKKMARSETELENLPRNFLIWGQTSSKSGLNLSSIFTWA
jgi:hypothetical protein